MSVVSAGTAVLMVTDWEETATSAFHESDTWAKNYKHQVRVYGKIHKWVLTCVEQNVLWANSAANYLYGIQSAGTSILLSSNDPRRPLSAVSVVVAQVALKIALEGISNIRRFTVDFREYLT
jgi:hypothetical protein